MDRYWYFVGSFDTRCTHQRAMLITHSLQSRCSSMQSSTQASMQASSRPGAAWRVQRARGSMPGAACQGQHGIRVSSVACRPAHSVHHIAQCGREGC